MIIKGIKVATYNISVERAGRRHVMTLVPSRRNPNPESYMVDAEEITLSGLTVSGFYRGGVLQKVRIIPSNGVLPTDQEAEDIASRYFQR